MGGFALPRYQQDAPNRAAAVEQAALAVVREAKDLPRHALFEQYVHPVLNQLGRERLMAASRVGRLRLAPPPLTSAGLASPKLTTGKPQLDVRGMPGVNKFEKLMAYAQSRAAASLSHAEAHRQASHLNDTHRVVA